MRTLKRLQYRIVTFFQKSVWENGWFFLSRLRPKMGLKRRQEYTEVIIVVLCIDYEEKRDPDIQREIDRHGSENVRIIQ